MFTEIDPENDPVPRMIMVSPERLVVVWTTICWVFDAGVAPPAVHEDEAMVYVATVEPLIPITLIVVAPAIVTMPPVAVCTWNARLLRVNPPPAEEIEKLYQCCVPALASAGGATASAVPNGVFPGPFVNPEIRM